MHLIRKVLSCIFSVSCIFTGFNRVPTITQPFSSHKYQNGVGNLTAWINYSSGAGMWIDYINGGINNWMYTGWDNPVYITVTSSNVGSNMDFHAHATTELFDDGDLAFTSFWLGDGTKVSPYTSNWYYAEIHINNTAFLSDTFSNYNAYGTVRHEIGHALGLEHNNMNPQSIMCQLGSGRTVNTVQYTDNSAVNTLYGG